MNIQTDKKRSQSMYFFPTFILTNGLIKARDNNYKVVFVSMTFYYIKIIIIKKNMKKKKKEEEEEEEEGKIK